MTLFYWCTSKSKGNHFIHVFRRFYLILSKFFRLCKQTFIEELKIKVSLVWIMFQHEFVLTVQGNGGLEEAAMKPKADTSVGAAVAVTWIRPPISRFPELNWRREHAGDKLPSVIMWPLTLTNCLSSAPGPLSSSVLLKTIRAPVQRKCLPDREDVRKGTN